jgi:hypothetical protein
LRNQHPVERVAVASRKTGERLDMPQEDRQFFKSRVRDRVVEVIFDLAERRAVCRLASLFPLQ